MQASMTVATTYILTYGVARDGHMAETRYGHGRRI